MTDQSAAVDAYIRTFPANAQQALEAIRQIINEAAPEAVESIAYGMPAYKLSGKPLVYFGGYKNHVGLYATPSGHSAFAKELSKYKQGKGSVQFPLDEPMPLDLIARIVQFRVNELRSENNMNNGISAYHDAQSDEDRAICDLLRREIDSGLPEAESKVWHGHPVWFLDGNPTVGYSKQKAGVRLMFWSGADFDEPGLKPGTGKYKDASATYQSAGQINTEDVRRWLEKSRHIRWDYKNIVKRKGQLVRLE